MNNSEPRLVEVLEEHATEQQNPDIETESIVDNRAQVLPKLKALIVDDVPVNRLVTRQMLKSKFECREAENGEQAVHYFSEEQPDLILMDISMPVMDGVEALKKIRELNSSHPTIPIIAVTTGGSFGGRKELMEEGFSEFIRKPVAQKELFDKISYFLPNSFDI